MSDLDVRVATFQARVDAELARAKLQAHGIEAHVESDDAGGAYPPLERAGVYLLVRAVDVESATEILSRSESAPEDAPGDLAEAEEAVRQREPSRIGLLGSPLLDAALLLLLGAVAGFILSESEILETRHNVFLYADAVEVDRNLDGRTDAWFVYRGPDITRSRLDRNFDGEPDYWDFFRDGLVVRSELDDNFDGEIDGWLKYEFGNISVFVFDTDYNGAGDRTTDYRHGLPASSRLHPNGGPIEREERYLNGELREVYSVAPDGSRTLIRAYDEVGRELNATR